MLFNLYYEFMHNYRQFQSKYDIVEQIFRKTYTR